MSPVSERRRGVSPPCLSVLLGSPCHPSQGTLGSIGLRVLRTIPGPGGGILRERTVPPENDRDPTGRPGRRGRRYQWRLHTGPYSEGTRVCRVPLEEGIFSDRHVPVQVYFIQSLILGPCTKIERHNKTPHIKRIFEAFRE